MLDLCIMIVEDEPQILESFEKMLKREVREVHAFERADIALNALEDTVPDAIVTDIRMPGTSGLEMVRIIRERGIECHIIIVSAYSDPDFFQQAIRLRVDQFIIKPLKMEELIAALHRIAEIRELQQRYAEQSSLLDQYKRIVDESSIVSKTDLFGNITYVNDAFEAITGYSKEELIAQNHRIVRHPDMPDSFFEQMWHTILSGSTWHGIIKNRDKNGKSYYVDTTIAPIYDKNNQIAEFISIRTDVTKLQESLNQTRQLEREKQRYLSLIDENIITSTTDLSGTILSVSEAFCRISGYSKEELIGSNHRIVRHPEMPASLYEDLWRTISSGATWRGEIKNRMKTGGYYWVDAIITPLVDDSGKKIGYTAIRQDITAQKKVEELSVTDRLTALFNRHRLDEVIEKEIARSTRYETALSVVLADIDHFKRVNDTFGHLAGDHLLQAFAKILRQQGRISDTIGRWGGEEFLIILPQTDHAGAMVFAQKLCKQIAAYPFDEVGHQSASFGVAMLVTGETPDQLVQRADRALYEAKHAGRNCVRG